MVLAEAETCLGSFVYVMAVIHFGCVAADMGRHIWRPMFHGASFIFDLASALPGMCAGIAGDSAAQLNCRMHCETGCWQLLEPLRTDLSCLGAAVCDLPA